MNAFARAHRARRRFSTEEMRALMLPGISQSEAARRLGVTQSAIAHRLRSEGLSWPAQRPEVNAEVFARLWTCRGIGTERIAQALGMTRQAVSYRAHRMGLPSRKSERQSRVRRDEFRALWLAGVFCKDIAAHFGLSHPSTVTAMARRAGLPKRTKGKGRNGWLGSISMQEYADQRLAAIMEAEAQRHAA